jgi:hypothetical protein
VRIWDAKDVGGGFEYESTVDFLSSHTHLPTLAAQDRLEKFSIEKENADRSALGTEGH